MKIYSIDSNWIGDDTEFKNMSPAEGTKWGVQTFEALRRGEPVKMKWAADAGGKMVADFIMFPKSGLASSDAVIAKLRRFAPANPVSKIVIDGDDSGYAFLSPKNHSQEDMLIEHIFMMFEKYKSLLVSQEFKDEWERQGLTGAVFEYVTEMDDSRFIQVAPAES